MVTEEVLWDTVWPETAAGNEVKTSMSDWHKALGDMQVLALLHQHLDQYAMVMTLISTLP